MAFRYYTYISQLPHVMEFYALYVHRSKVKVYLKMEYTIFIEYMPDPGKKVFNQFTVV